MRRQHKLTCGGGTQSMYREARLLLLLLLLLTVWVSSTHGWISTPAVTRRQPTKLLGSPQEDEKQRRRQQQQQQQTPLHQPSILFITEKGQLSWRRLVQSCQSAACGLALSWCVLFAPISQHVQAAFAVDEVMVVTTKSSSTSTSTSSVSSAEATSSTQEVSNVLQETALPKPDAVGTIDRLMTISPPPKRQEQSSLDDVWSLIDKYYIDKTFNGQDWNQVKIKYDAKLEKIKSYKSNNNGHSDNTQKQNEQEMHLITEMVALLNDKYSRVLDVQQYTAIQKYDLIGVGVTLMPDADKNIIVGAPPIAGSAADLAGLQLGDGVTAVNGIPTKGRTAFDIIDQISENPNAATVTMTITSSSSSSSPSSAPAGREVVLSRTFQEIKNPVRYKISETRNDGTKVGFIRILEFNSLVKANLEEALAALKAQGANAFVLDLRMNTGGAFQSAVEISSLFMEDRIATYVVDGADAKLPFKTPKGRMAIDANIPIAVWIDGTSASASEVLAGSLHDNCRAILMGDQSFGKGLIQAVYGLKNGAGLVLTVARYVTPSGSDIQGVGIKPDIRGQVGIPIPGLSTDTSKVDFDFIKSRLDPAVCQIPPVATS